MKRTIYILFILLFACVVIVQVSTYEAQAFFWFFRPKPKPRPTPKPTPTPADCTEVENQLAACTENLDTCNSSLGACGSDLNACNSDLGQALTDLGVCNADLGTCNADLGQAQTDLTACSSDLDTCSDDLAACEANAGSTFPGDGYPNPDAFGVSDHGPALSYTDNGDGTFTDNNTGLMWEIKDDAGGIHDKDNSYTWTGDGIVGTAANGALFTVFLNGLNNTCDGTGVDACATDADCAGIGNEICGFAGHQDWRIPNVKELQSIVDYSVFNPASSVPGLTTASLYWSSTTTASSVSGAWLVAFLTGHVNNGGKSGSNFARAVRP